jgi:hypothetical protein
MSVNGVMNQSRWLFFESRLITLVDGDSYLLLLDFAFAFSFLRGVA